MDGYELGHKRSTWDEVGVSYIYPGKHKRRSKWHENQNTRKQNRKHLLVRRKRLLFNVFLLNYMKL